MKHTHMVHHDNWLYYNAIDQIYHAEWQAKKLSRFLVMQKAIKSLWPNGHPTRCIQITGTSGKGSVTKYIEAGLSLFGTAASFTSPHIFDFCERFSINGVAATQEAVRSAWENKIQPICIKNALLGEAYILNFQEVCLLVALVIFAEHHIKLAAVEVGMGGRYDPTSVLDVEASVLTNVGKDHEHVLGQEKWQRALDKVGVVRKNKPFFTAEQDVLLLDIFKDVCGKHNSEYHTISTNDLKVFGNIQPQYRLYNTALAHKVVSHFHPELTAKHFLSAIRQVKIIGRFQEIEKDVYIDVAHNFPKMEALCDDIRQTIPKKRKIFVVGVSGDRKAREVLKPIFSLKPDVFIATEGFYKACAAETVKQDCLDFYKNIHLQKDPKEAMKLARSLQKKGDVIIVTGSTYLIDQIFNDNEYLGFIDVHYGWREKM